MSNAAATVRRGHALRRGLASDQLGLIVAIAALCFFISRKTPYFFDTANFSNIGIAISYIGIITAGFTLVMIAGGIDLSVGAVAALSGQVFAYTLNAGTPGAPVRRARDRRRRSLSALQLVPHGRDRYQRDRWHHCDAVSLPWPCVHVRRWRRCLDRDRGHDDQRSGQREVARDPDSRPI